MDNNQLLSATTDNKQLAFNKQLALFDYNTLDLDTRFFVQTKTAEIRILVKQTAQGIIEIGQRLIEVKERLPHGEFLPWIRDEFGWSEKTAVDWMNVTKTFKSVPGTDLNMFQAKALYLLSAPSTPEPAREEALTLAESGERITHQKAQELVARHKAEVEVAKKELAQERASKQQAQQAITSLEDRISSLESERSRLVEERSHFNLTKMADGRNDDPGGRRIPTYNFYCLRVK